MKLMGVRDAGDADHSFRIDFSAVSRKQKNSDSYMQIQQHKTQSVQEYRAAQVDGVPSLSCTEAITEMKAVSFSYPGHDSGGGTLIPHVLLWLPRLRPAPNETQLSRFYHCLTCPVGQKCSPRYVGKMVHKPPALHGSQREDTRVG